jgi:hypothetical protein
MKKQKYKVTKVYIECSDGCYANIEIDEILLNHHETIESQAEFIGYELIPFLYAMKQERASKHK